MCYYLVYYQFNNLFRLTAYSLHIKCVILIIAIFEANCYIDNTHNSNTLINVFKS